MSNTTFSGPVTSNNGFVGDVVGATQVPTYTVANAISASGIAGTIIYVSNGAAGSAILAFSDGTNWKRSDTGATIAAA
tara:strand:- start:628 stop:861 length:234 start_codon:yes stop_codon:yes gene_type:complete